MTKAEKFKQIFGLPIDKYGCAFDIDCKECPGHNKKNDHCVIYEYWNEEYEENNK